MKKQNYIVAHMSTKGGVKALADMPSKNVIFFWTALPLLCWFCDGLLGGIGAIVKHYGRAKEKKNIHDRKASKNWSWKEKLKGNP